MALQDKTLTCRECGQEFIFTAGEQEFYASRGLLNEPGRCPECRSARRRERSGGYGAPRESFPAVCAACGAETTVPFEPREGRPVYCKECYTKMKESGELDNR
ncbi:zinc-ribbon domain containing protein [Chloroflexota bacterium]